MSWGYGHDNGPSTWQSQFPHARGSHQSPVDIDNHTTVVNWGLPTSPLNITYYDEANMKLVNNGHTLVATAREPSIMTGGPMKQQYQLEQLHFHWGSNDHEGSEHTVDGQSFAAELHVVHWNRTRYSSYPEAQSKNDGLAVLAVFIQIGAEHKDMQCLTTGLHDVKYPGGCSHVRELFNPRSLLPQKLTDYWTYSGSLTTPPCYESVTWILFKEPMEISISQLNSLRSLCRSHHDGDHIEDNHRPTCPLGDRKIRASFVKSRVNHPHHPHHPHHNNHNNHAVQKHNRKH